MSTAAHPSSPTASHVPQPVDLAAESVAGEEDPGASIDMAAAATSDPPAGGGIRQPGTPQAPMAPGDEAPPGTPSTGEDVCPQCGGTGRLGASACPNCQGTGKVIVGIGGA